MKSREKYKIPSDERYRSVLDEKKRTVVNVISYGTCILSLISSFRLLKVSDLSYNLTPAAITMYVCEIVMFISMILSVALDFKNEETVSYQTLMRSHGILLIAGLAGMLFGLASFQRPPVPKLMLWISIITAGITGICSGIVYTSYQKVKKQK